MIRLFAAIAIPPEVGAALAPLCEGIPGAHWHEAAKLHLTLRFMGDIDEALAEVDELAVVLPPSPPSPLEVELVEVEVDADGERLMVSAKEQLVLRCGKASITLTKEGKVLIQGAYVSSRSSGVNRIKGGSVQLN